MPRVGEQGKAAAEPACGGFHQHKAGDDGERNAQDMAVGAAVAVAVAAVMGVVVRMVVRHGGYSGACGIGAA